MSKSNELAQRIKECQKGRAEGFTWLLEEYGPRLYGYFLRCTGSGADAEDLLQELFVRLLENISGYHHEGLFENWMFRIAANLVRDRGRREQRGRKTVSLQAVEEGKAELTNMLTSREGSVDGRMIHAEETDRLQKALAELSAVDREIILLRHYGEMSFKEIAEQFGMPLGTALAKVHRGLKTMNRILTDHERE
jgi:RNA polymerase sigma factor (sigma-70 family)